MATEWLSEPLCMTVIAAPIRGRFIYSSGQAQLGHLNKKYQTNRPALKPWKGSDRFGWSVALDKDRFGCRSPLG